MDEASDRRRNVVTALDSAIQTLSALRENHKFLSTLSLASDFKNPLPGLDSLRCNGNTSEDAFMVAKASYREILSSLEISGREMDDVGTHVDKAVKIFHDARNHLDDLRHAVANELGCLSRSHGLARLPDDVLSLVFEATHSITYEAFRKAVPFQIASVCRRFREVALSTPRIWSLVSSKWKNIDVLNLSLLRCPATELHIEAVSSSYQRTDEDFDGFKSFLEVLGVHRKRWESLKFDGDSKAYDAFKEHLSSSGSSGTLLRLQALELGGIKDPESFFRFLEKYASNLRSLTMDIAFDPNSDVRLPHGITRLCVVPTCFGVCIDTRRFVAMLQSTRIEELQLEFYCFDEEFVYEHEVRDGRYKAKEYQIDGVRSLEIQVLARQTVVPLFESLYFPDIEKLVLEIPEPCEGAVIPKYEDEEEEDGLALGLELLETWFEGREFPKLRSIALKMDLQVPKPGKDYINFPMGQIMDVYESSPRLEDLEFSCSHLTDGLLLPPLRSLTLSHVKMTDSWLREYGDDLKENGKLDSLQKVVLNCCKMDDVAFDQEDWSKELPDFAGKLVVISERL